MVQGIYRFMDSPLLAEYAGNASAMEDATSKILSFKILPFKLQFALVDSH